MNRSMMITEDLFCDIFQIVCPWNFSVLLSAAVVLAAAERKSTTATPQGVLES